MTPTSGTFLVTDADAGAAVLQDVETSQVYSVDDHPALESGELIEATIAPVPPMEVVWEIEAIVNRWDVTVTIVETAPSEQAATLAAECEPGTVTQATITDTETIHVIPLAESNSEQAATEIRDDEATRRRAGRLGASRVEIRPAEEFISVRYHAVATNKGT